MDQKERNFRLIELSKKYDLRMKAKDDYSKRIDDFMESIGEELADVYTRSCHVMDIDDMKEVRRRLGNAYRQVVDFIKREEER